MKKFALYHPFSGKYVSNLVYDRKTKQYNFQLTYNLYIRLGTGIVGQVQKRRLNVYLLGIEM